MCNQWQKIKTRESKTNAIYYRLALLVTVITK